MTVKKGFSPKVVSIAFGIFIFLFVLAFYVIAWTEPGSAPPGGNVPAPINVGDTGQAKAGNLGIGALDGSYGLTVETGGDAIKAIGNSWFDGTFQTTGNVGLGGAPAVFDPDPDENIRVHIIGGDLDMNNNKIKNVTEIDPIFIIDEARYSTYMPDMIGQTIEVIGEAVLEGDELVIDFEELTIGSDLWLFWQGAYRASIVPFVSSQSDASLYSYIEDDLFIIKLRSGQKNAKFSYRLIATRIDHKDDIDYLYDDQSAPGININELRK